MDHGNPRSSLNKALRRQSPVAELVVEQALELALVQALELQLCKSMKCKIRSRLHYDKPEFQRHKSFRLELKRLGKL